MLGVVLWSDTDDNKAVIWCEDHGNLAFFNGGSHPSLDVFDFDAGDLVQFEMTEEQHMRFARNPKRVSQSQYPTLAEDLQSMTMEHVPEPKVTQPKAAASFKSADIIPFSRRIVRPERDGMVLA